MIPVGGAGPRQALILAAHLTALAAGLLYAWTQWTAVAAQGAATRQNRLALEELDRRLAAPGAARLSVSGLGADPFLEGQTPAIAGANLQDRVVSAVRSAGGTVTSSQLEPTETGSPGNGSTLPALQLTVAFELGGGPLQKLLYGLEGGLPAMVVDRLSIEANDAGRGDALKVTMSVSGFRRGNGKS